MRISDWSSDVCSSDLPWACTVGGHWPSTSTPTSCSMSPAAASRTSRRSSRSEEHTSELQSLMRISYAVFCLIQKTKTTSYTTDQCINMKYTNKHDNT